MSLTSEQNKILLKIAKAVFEETINYPALARLLEAAEDMGLDETNPDMNKLLEYIQKKMPLSK